MIRLPLALLAISAIAGGLGPAQAGVMPAPWTPPSQYSLDMEVKSQGETHVLHRAVSMGRTRTEMELPNGQQLIVLEMGDEAGTVYTLFPDQGVGIKQTSASKQALAEAVGAERSVPREGAVQEESGSEPAQIQHVKRQTVDGIPCNLYAITQGGHTACTWNDVKTQRPVRMQSEDGRITWKNFRAAPQKEELFEIPAGMQIEDMAVWIEEMNAAGMGSMLQAVAGWRDSENTNETGLGNAAQWGNGWDAGLDPGMGGALDGTLGAIAGQYLGGSVGEMFGRDVAGNPMEE